MLKRFSALVVALALSGCATSTPPLNTAKTLIVEAIDTLHQFSLHKELKNYKQFMDDAEEVFMNYRDARNRSRAIRKARGFPQRMPPVQNIASFRSGSSAASFLA